jgi:hypothetical protein
MAFLLYSILIMILNSELLGMARVFISNTKKEVLEDQALTEIRRALSEVGSGLITHLPYQPQAKGK